MARKQLVSVILMFVTSVASFASGIEIQVNVHIASAQSSNRVRRSEDVFPVELIANFHAFDTDIQLHLKRSDHTNPIVPVYIQRNGRVREEKIQRRHPDRASNGIPQECCSTVTLSSTENHFKFYLGGWHFMVTAFYQDVGYLASVSASCHGGFHGDGECNHVLFGHLVINGENHRIEPLPDGQLKETSIDDHMRHSIIFVQHDMDYKTDYIFPEYQSKLLNEMQHKGTESSSRKEKADLKVELLPAVDFAVYDNWYKRSEEKTDAARREEALEHIREFYAYVINAMDVRYQGVVSESYTLSVIYTGIYIADSSLQSTWTEIIKTPTGQVDAMTALHLFKGWLQSTPGLPHYDHAMSFTGYDLVYGGSSAYAGLAYVGGICGEHDMSILEERPDAILGVLAAHDLGHNLNAMHDGDGNSCKSTDRWVMSSATGVFIDDKSTNHFTFSSCSVDSFTDFISDLDNKETNCLATLTSGHNPDALIQYTDVPGQLYPLDVQCQQHMGNASSHFCRRKYTDPSVVCQYALCSRPEDPQKCVPIIAWEGTQCGNGKLCIAGECQDDSRATVTLIDECIFGDSPEVFGNGDTCSSLIQDWAGHCYDDTEISRSCCKSCATAYTGVYECEYGDKLRKCSGTPCSDKSPKEQQLCCATCGVHKETGVSWSKKTQPVLTVDTESQTDGVNKSPTNQDVSTFELNPGSSLYINNPEDVAATCTDIPGDTLFSLTCAVLGANFPIYCYPAYNAVLGDDCCATCLALNDTCLPNCSHGDTIQGCGLTSSCPTKTPADLASCCRTCNTAFNVCSSTTTTPTTALTSTTTATTTGNANSVAAASASKTVSTASSEFPTAAVASVAAIGTATAGGVIVYVVYRRLMKNAIQKITPSV